MRAFVLLLVFVMPALAACSVAVANPLNAHSEIGKPVCAHFDDNAKPASRATDDAAATTAIVATATATSVGTGTAAPATAGNTGTQQVKGGSSGLNRPHTAPHWQTFLPGMFK